jgi:hypothetical protein
MITRIVCMQFKRILKFCFLAGIFSFEVTLGMKIVQDVELQYNATILFSKDVIGREF